MLYKIFLTLVCVVASLRAFSWTDTLVYRSAFEERTILRALDKRNSDLLALYSVITTDSALSIKYANQLNAFYTLLDKKVAAINSNKQKSKVIFKVVHDYFLKQYQEHVSFNSIFENGRYNCVTGSMLYTLILRKYGIPYEIKEKPTHVYLVAYPGSDDILFETTDPKGLYVPDEKQKKAFLDRLIALKFTTDEHVRSVGISNAFNEFYYNNESISDIQLAALQYMNFALSDLQSERNESAVRNILKTNLLYPSAKHQYMTLEMLGALLRNSNYSNIIDVRYMCEYANACRDNGDKNIAKATFEKIVNSQLIENDNESFVSDAYAICKERIRDSSLIKDISYEYHYAMAYRYGVKGDWTKSLNFATEAYTINPKNVTIQEMILRAILLKSDEIAVEKRATTIEGFGVTYPFLQKNNSYKALLIYAYAYQSYTLFSQNSEAEGYRYMRKAEEAMKGSWNKFPQMDQAIGLMYAEAGAFHFRKQEYEKAKEILLAGLKVVPDHSEIRARLEIVEDENMRPPGRKH